MSEEDHYYSDLRVDVHLDAYLSLTRLADRRWRIGVMLQPRQADTGGWWVNDAEVTLTCASGPLVSAVTVATEACMAVEPQLRMARSEEKVWGFHDQIDASFHASSEVMTTGSTRLTWAAASGSRRPTSMRVPGCLGPGWPQGLIVQRRTCPPSQAD